MCAEGWACAGWERERGSLGVTCVQRVLCVLSVEPWSDLCPACPVYVEFGGDPVRG